jgi:hypothetical protein
MNRPTRWVTLLVSLAGLLAAATVVSRTSLVPGTRADGGDRSCSRSGISGVYAASFRGFVTVGTAMPPVAAAGFIRIFPDGTITGRDTLSVGGVITPRTITGTYTVGRDPATGACRGTATTSVGNFSFATTGEGRITGALFVSIDPGNTVEGRTIRQGSGRDGGDHDD